MTHCYVLREDRFILLRQILLAICLLISMINAVFMITVIALGNWDSLILVLIIWLILLLIRIPTTFLIHSYNYKFNDNCLEIIKSYPMHDKKPIIIEYDKINEIIKLDKNYKACNLTPKSCDFKKYMIKYQNENYIIALDEYGYCIISRSINDLSR